MNRNQEVQGSSDAGQQLEGIEELAEELESSVGDLARQVLDANTASGEALAGMHACLHAYREAAESEINELRQQALAMQERVDAEKQSHAIVESLLVDMQERQLPVCPLSPARLSLRRSRTLPHFSTRELVTQL